MKMMTKIKKTERNIGLEILRLLLCFWVVLFHSINHSNVFLLNYIVSKKFHVPCFFFISFYFFFPIVNDRNCVKMKLRLKRLFIPFFLWPIISWSFNNIFYLIFATNRFGRLLSFSELKVQLIVGRKFFIQLWFLFNLLFFSLFFFIISFFLKKYFLFFVILIGIISIIFQYSKYKYNLFIQYKDSISCSIGLFVFSFPIAVLAFCFKKINLISYFEKNYIKSFIVIFVFLYYLFKQGAPYTYLGIDKSLFSLLTFLGFYLIPLNKYLNSRCKSIIYFITNYTQGIYCIHIMIKRYIFKFFNIKPTFPFSILLYIICYFLSFIGKKTFEKSEIKYLFI